MKAYEFNGIGVSEYFFGKRHETSKSDGETHDQFDKRAWQEKVNLTSDGQCFIPPFALKNGLESAARRIQLKVPGQNKTTFTKLFTQGIFCVEPLLMYRNGKPLRLADVVPKPLFVPSSGKRGQGSRVDRTFPTLTTWEFHASLVVFDEKITGEVLKRHLEELARYIGFGAMRVEGGGVNGRWKLENFAEVELKEAA